MTSRPPSTPPPLPGKFRVARVRVRVVAASVVSGDVTRANFGKTRQAGGLCKMYAMFIMRRRNHKKIWRAYVF
jgi:hypothetical protein